MSGTITARPSDERHLPSRIWHVTVAVLLALAVTITVALFVVAIRGDDTVEPRTNVDAPVCEPSRFVTAC